MKLWHLLAIGGIAYLLLRKPTVTAAVPVTPAVPTVTPTTAVDTSGMTPEYAAMVAQQQAAAVQAAAAAAAQAAGAAVPGVPSAPLFGVGWARV